MGDARDIESFDESWDRAMSASTPIHENSPERIEPAGEYVAHVAIRLHATADADAAGEVEKLREALETAGADVASVGWGRRSTEPPTPGTANVSGEPVTFDDLSEEST